MKSWSKKTRISIMMVLDTVFLAIELGVGYYVQSLALIADAFHMVRSCPRPPCAALVVSSLFFC